MGNKYTAEQQKVIDERDKNILVSAAAGSGKTAVLTERIISLITDEKHPIDLDHILVLTYTKAAAAEMRERIDGAINKKLSEDMTNENLQKQQLLIQNAQISTLHSFCIFVLHNNFSDIGLDPGFRVMDEGERKLLLEDILGDILEEYYKDEEDEDFVRLVECYASSLSEGSLEDTILYIHNFILSLKNPLDWLDNAKNDFAIRDIAQFQNRSWWKEATLPRIEDIIEKALALSNKALLICNEDGGPTNSITGFQDYISIFSALRDRLDYKARYDILQNAKISRFNNSPKADPDKKKIIKDIKEFVTDCFKELRDVYYLANADTFIKDNSLMEAVAIKLLEVTKKLYESFNAKKRELNVIDFSDMEHLTLAILQDEDGNPSKAALEYRQYYDEVMVDEYQDINDVQEAILKSISRDNNYFMVGDVKQSIYKFRQARPEIFIGKYDSFETGENTINKRIDLNKNFRSRKEVLEFVNLVFEDAMTKKISGIEYDENASLKAGALCYKEDYFESYKPEIMLVTKPSKEEIKNLELSFDDRAAEALMVANKINELVSSGKKIYDKEIDGYRDLSYKDIVILLFSVSEHGKIFKEVLEAQGIATVTSKGAGYFDAVEIKQLLNYLEVITNPVQDIPLYGALTSFFGGFTDEEVAIVKTSIDCKSRSLYKTIRRFVEEEDENDKNLYDLKIRVQEFLEKIESYRFASTYLGVRDLLEKIILDFDYADYLLAKKDGVQKNANVELLLEKASDFEKTSFHGLFRFNRYIKRIKAKEADASEAMTLDENEDAVRIMTIHKSKGLEYPICFLAATDAYFKNHESKNSAVCDRDYGLCLDMVDPVRRIKRKSYKKMILAKNTNISNLAEQLRVLYVALTRAREKLYITASLSEDKFDKKGNVTYARDAFLDSLNYEGGFNDLSVLFMNSYLKILANTIASHGLSKLYFKFYNASNLKNDKDLAVIKAGLTKELLLGGNIKTDDDYYDLITDRLSYQYPYGYLSKLKGKFSVSELKEIHSIREYADEEDDNKNFVKHIKKKKSKDKVSKVSKGVIGTVTHRLLELIDFKLIYDKCDGDFSNDRYKNLVREVIDETIALAAESGKLNQRELDIIDTGAGGEFVPRVEIPEYFDSDLSKRMILAASKNKLWKEKSFFMGLSASEINDEYPESEEIIIQGIIDFYFEDEDGLLVLADYKTDDTDYIPKDGGRFSTADTVAKTREEKMEALRNRHKYQLDKYAQALEAITGKKVKEKIIYSLDLDCEIKV